MLAVASSRSSTFGFANSARAKFSSCRSPTEKFEPPSATSVSSASSEDASGETRRTETSASRMASSDDVPNGSTHSRKVVPAMKGSCGMMLMPPGRPRTSFRPILAKSTSSNKIRPDSISVRRKRATVNELLPAPVLPTTPTRFPPGIWNDSESKASGNPSRYLKHTFSKSSFPSEGHDLDSGFLVASVSMACSCGMVVIASTRSIDVMAASPSAK
mmetsp:Transcript_23229/g.65812  ORF Transcript_23229/g.65812 Transcript_23229/m.65812 type:complete len:216 (-) Transcript_23229:654-1301(-)